MKKLAPKSVRSNPLRLLLLFLIVPLIGCGLSTGTPVHFVVPDGHQGMVYLILDPTKGVVIPKKDGRFIVTFPVGGKLHVRDFRFINSWHQETAAFSKGTRIPTSTEPGRTAELAPGEVGFRGGGTSWDGNGREYIWYFIGTQSDLETAK